LDREDPEYRLVFEATFQDDVCNAIVHEQDETAFLGNDFWHCAQHRFGLREVGGGN